MSLNSRSWIALAVLLLLGVAAALVRLAWVGDDAYVTLRTVEHFVEGNGLVWNLSERVQTYTHPLWLFVLAGMRLLTGEAYYGTIGVSWVLTLASVVVMMRQAGSWAGAAAVAALLLGSRSFLDFGVCGLENPLSFLLLAGFAAVAMGPADTEARIRRTTLLAALAATTRLDLGLLCAPILLTNLRGRTFGSWLSRTTLCMTPLIGWLLFATFYYGSPFPITALAKATNLGVPFLDLCMQGVYFYQYTWMHDPLTLVILGAGIGLGLVRGGVGSRPLALGAVIYCAYIVAVGGDFMAGRFFTPPLIFAVAIVARTLAQASAWQPIATIVATAAITVLPGVPQWLRAPALDAPPTADFHGIADERSVYYRQQGLLSPKLSVPVPGGLTRDLRAIGRSEPLVMIYGVAGRYPFEAGDLLHVVDHCLLDPLLMRLPIPDPKSWRIGHFVRAMPEGYLESIAQDKVCIHYPGLASYYATLRTVIDVRVPLFAPERLRALWDLWTGKHAGGFAAYLAEEYRNPPTIDVDGASLAKTLPNAAIGTGPQWFDEPQGHLVLRGGIRIRFADTVHARRLDLQLQGGRDLIYRLRVHRDGKMLGEHRVDASSFLPAAGMQPFACELPLEQQAFDMIFVDIPAFPVDMIACVGSLRLAP
jgi:arabinofuranosyltransferase